MINIIHHEEERPFSGPLFYYFVPVHFLFLLIALVFGSSAVFAAEAVDSLESQNKLSEISTVPLPGQTAYMEQGLSFGMGFGVYDPLEECDCMGAWQVQLEYFYSDWISGGADVRYFGGDLDRDAMVMYQRYRLNVRLHLPSDEFDLFVEPFMGLENTSISAFRKQVHGKNREGKRHYWWDDSEDEEVVDSLEVNENDNCQRLFSLDGFSIGLGIGGGLNLNRLFGLTGGVHMEYNFSKEFLLSIVPGVAFNLREVWPWAKRTLRSSWISFEIGGQKTFNRGIEEFSNTYFIGFQIGA